MKKIIVLLALLLLAPTAFAYDGTASVVANQDTVDYQTWDGMMRFDYLYDGDFASSDNDQVVFVMNEQYGDGNEANFSMAPIDAAEPNVAGYIEFNVKDFSGFIPGTVRYALCPLYVSEEDCFGQEKGPIGTFTITGELPPEE